MRIILTALTLIATTAAYQGVASAQFQGCEGVVFDACGGSLEGTWNYDEVTCLDAPSISDMFPGCEGGSLTMGGSIEGATTFNADGSYTEEQNRNLNMTIAIPLTCLPPGVTCDMMAQPGTGATATASETDCTLSMAQAEQESEAGTYAVVGSTATLTQADGNVDTGNFCVAGDVLTVEMTDPGASGMRMILTFSRAAL